MDKNKFLTDLAQSNRTDCGKVAFAKQSEEQKVFSAIWVLEGEVNNGGFMQYFQNDRGETVGFVLHSLMRIGAVNCARIVARAIKTVGYGLFTTGEHSDALIAAMNDEATEVLDGLDSEFYKYPDNLTDLLFEFVRRHPRAFGLLDTK